MANTEELSQPGIQPVRAPAPTTGTPNESGEVMNCVFALVNLSGVGHHSLLIYIRVSNIVYITCIIFIVL